MVCYQVRSESKRNVSVENMVLKMNKIEDKSIKKDKSAKKEKKKKIKVKEEKDKSEKKEKRKR